MILPLEKIRQIERELFEMLHLSVCLTDIDGRVMTSENFGEVCAKASDLICRPVKASGDMIRFDGEEGMAVLTVDGNSVGTVAVKGLGQSQENQLIMAKRLAELLIQNGLLEQQEHLHSINRSDLIRQWIFNDFVSKDNTFETCAKIAGIDISGRYVAAVLQILPPSGERLSELNQEKIDHIKARCARHLEDLAGDIMLEDKIVFLFRTENPVAVQKNLAVLKKSLEESCHVSVSGGVGPTVNDYTDVHASYEKAEKACAISHKSRGTQVMRYEELSIDLLVEEIPAQIKADFVGKVFANCKKSDVEEWKVLLRTFFTQSGSIGKTAEILFVHKNTLQYKLNKIRELTGYDPRNTCDALKLYLAILFDSGQGC